MKEKRKQYLYKLTRPFIKHPCFLEAYGFKKYTDESEEETFYAKGIKLSLRSSIVKYIKAAFEKIYSIADNKEDFSEYEFDSKGKVVMTEKVKKEFTRCQLCIPLSGLGANTLFINAPDRIEYYNSEVLDECVKKDIDKLLKNKVIYAKRYIQR